MYRNSNTEKGRGDRWRAEEKVMGGGFPTVYSVINWRIRKAKLKLWERGSVIWGKSLTSRLLSGAQGPYALACLQQCLDRNPGSDELPSPPHFLFFLRDHLWKAQAQCLSHHSHCKNGVMKLRHQNGDNKTSYLRNTFWEMSFNPVIQETESTL